MVKIDHLMAEKNNNNKDSQKGQVTPKNIFKKLGSTRLLQVSGLKHRKGCPSRAVWPENVPLKQAR
jgi:hypothetical protein